jgi:hypothetical protein
MYLLDRRDDATERLYWHFAETVKQGDKKEARNLRVEKLACEQTLGTRFGKRYCRIY